MSTGIYPKPWKLYLWQILVCGIARQHDWVDFGAIREDVDGTMMVRRG